MTRTLEWTRTGGKTWRLTVREERPVGNYATVEVRSPLVCVSIAAGGEDYSSAPKISL